jgi:hypothetical protein
MGEINFSPIYFLWRKNMKITKGEAIALNLWEDIKKIKEIDESTPESIIKYYTVKGTSFLPKFFLNPHISEYDEFEFDVWEILKIVKLRQEV